jgi:hypothetical protein
METTQGNSLCSYLYLKLAKTSGSAQEVVGWGVGISGKREVMGKGIGG